MTFIPPFLRRKSARVAAVGVALLLVAAACGDPNASGFDMALQYANNTVDVDPQGRVEIRLYPPSDTSIDASSIVLRGPNGEAVKPVSTTEVDKGTDDAYVSALFDVDSTGLFDRSSRDPRQINVCVEAVVVSASGRDPGSDCDAMKVALPSTLPPKATTTTTSTTAPPASTTTTTTTAPPPPPFSPVVSPAPVSSPWSSLVTAGTTPEGRTGAAMATDSHGNVVLFGGNVEDPGGGAATPSNETFVFDGTTWSAGPAAPPALVARRGAVMASLGTNLVLFGGFDASHAPLGDTWVWDGDPASTWVAVAGTHPPARGESVFAYSSSELVLFGGDAGNVDSLDDTWTFDGAAWTQETPATTPPGRYAASAATDYTAGDLVMYGGLKFDATAVTIDALADTWTWDGTDWHDENQNLPGTRSHAAMATSESGDHVVLFGGFDHSVHNEDAKTFVWDGTTKTWGMVSGGAHPAARSGHSMASHISGGKFSAILFGGSDGPSYFTDTWKFDPVPGA